MRWRSALPSLLGLLAALLAVGVSAPTVVRADSVIGVQGTDTSLPLTDSAVTMSGRGRFSNLKVTVNQTQHLVNQALSLTWTGGTMTQERAYSRFGSNFLQIFQCWGEDDGTNPDNPGPPPTQCEQGATGGSYQFNDPAYPGRFAVERIISQRGWPNYNMNVGVVDPITGNRWLPFKSVDGTDVPIQSDASWQPFVTGSYWINSYFNQGTTNEIAGARTREDGTGAELFQAYTGLEAPGLGCGQKVWPQQDGSAKVPKCWLVVVPRSEGSDENTGTTYAGAEADSSGVLTSPLMPGVWENRIAFPLEFNPLDTSCKLGRDDRQISGTELSFPAVANWQPQLCASGSLPPYSYAPVGDSTARQQLLSGQPGAPGLVVVQRAENADLITDDNPVVYSPLTVSGITVAFNYDRILAPVFDPAEGSIAGVRVAHISLTPRLVAKLLTQSYRGAVTFFEEPSYSWLPGNPLDLTKDPDFLRFNPEFANLTVFDTRAFSALAVPAGTSDSAHVVWQWILADPEAKAWLDGAADPWGMKVNPVYSTKASLNPTGTAFDDPIPTSFPKSDPYCYKAPAVGEQVKITPPALCSTDWTPYQRNFAVTAQVGRSTNDGAKVRLNPFPTSVIDVWSKAGPQTLGYHSMLVLTDTPNAALFGLQTAGLSRAGDDGDGRTFVEPNTAGLTAGVAAMKPSVEPTVLEPNPTARATGAYPLTTVSYAMVAPLSLDASARSDYAAFLQFATTDGQTPGLAFGQLPRGYLPMPQSLKTQAATTIDKVLHMTAPPTTTTTAPRTQTTRPRVQSSAPEPFITEPPTDTTPPSETTVSAPSTTSVPTTTVPPVLTPDAPNGSFRLVVPVAGGVAMVSALGALEITKRPRRILPRKRPK